MQDTAQMSGSPPLFPADEEVAAAPRFGQSGRDMILQAARLLEARAPAALPATPAKQPAAPQQPDSSDDAYTAAVPSQSRPNIAYDPRAKIPRITRQTALNRLVAQHLRLAAEGVPHQTKLVYAGQQDVWSAAIRDAVAQEAALLKRAGTKQVYQNLLARSKASDFKAEAAASSKAAEQRSSAAAAGPAASAPSGEPSEAAVAAAESAAGPDAENGAAGDADDDWKFGAAAASGGDSGHEQQRADPPAEEQPSDAAGVKRKHADMEATQPPQT